MAGGCQFVEMEATKEEIMTEEQKAQQLKDRRDYRQTLIQRREDIDTKIAKVEAEIKKLKGEK